VTTPALEFSQEMEPFDYLMFRCEGNPRMRSPIMAVSLLDTNPGIDRLRVAFDRASRVVLRLRQRVVEPALPVTSAQWVIDPDFDITYHVRRVRAPAPGGLRDVLDLATSMMSMPLDTGRPLWEAVLVEDVDDDGAEAALIMKVNHSLTDGVGAIELLLQLYDFERDANRGPMPHLPVPEDRSPTALVAKALRRAPVHAVTNAGRRLRSVVGGVTGVVRDPVGTVDGARRFAGAVRPGAGGPQAPASPLLRRRGLGRRLEVLDVPLDSLRAAAGAAGASLNDAYLAALCAALRRYHDELGVPVTAIPLAMPINIRTDDDPAGGNRFGGVRLVAPVGEPDPLERMRQIQRNIRATVEAPTVTPPDAVAQALSRLPGPLLDALASKAATTDINASNVRGYPDDPYVAGAKIVKAYWFGPLTGVAIMALLMSQAGTCFVGVHYDTASVTDSQLFARCLREGFDEVLAAAPRPRSAPRSTSRKKLAGRAGSR